MYDKAINQRDCHGAAEQAKETRWRRIVAEHRQNKPHQNGEHIQRINPNFGGS
jgi:hypothetical protein